MDGYASEKEQLEAIKNWFKANGKSLLTGLLLGAALLLGGRTWLSYQDSQAVRVSDQYQQMLMEVEQGETEAAMERGSRLVEEHGDSPYATLTALTLARLKLDSGDGAGARLYLQRVMDRAFDEGLKNLARVRMARLELAQGDAQAALEAVKTVQSPAFQGVLGELRGDIFLALSRKDEARAAYVAALAVAEGGIARTRLEMKLDELGSADGA
ncbi:MAG TPA: tetratricopeptide repeat protein [Gammaproteobacteria bacterium]|nr:tetratricopeptide repeat protein [Gammaproteobacteria bacterium]